MELLVVLLEAWAELGLLAARCRDLPLLLLAMLLLLGLCARDSCRGVDLDILGACWQTCVQQRSADTWHSLP